MIPIPTANSTGTGRRVATKRRAHKLIAFGWYGGKFSHLDFLAPLLPTDATHFCDVFGGSAALLLNVALMNNPLPDANPSELMQKLGAGADSI